MTTLIRSRRGVPVSAAASASRPCTRYAIAVGATATSYGPWGAGGAGRHATVTPSTITVSKPAGVAGFDRPVQGSTVSWPRSSATSGVGGSSGIGGGGRATTWATRAAAPPAVVASRAGAGGGPGSTSARSSHSNAQTPTSPTITTTFPDTPPPGVRPAKPDDSPLRASRRAACSWVRLTPASLARIIPRSHRGPPARPAPRPGGGARRLARRWPAGHWILYTNRTVLHAGTGAPSSLYGS